ncbi:hypothetical protein FAES_2872 [Fibrella aestuarina BUZ 2]|uniref:Uncharacterized protein n=1 Tax=Fibrella aestuarina BUZ 2 TaxID=1166018 RepID=I0K9S8_9BACT|nr:hypothetical protein [Fibrella aestuarina]CCH00881.1 hypothetical protein FAES_2872 [Fibrella aestuarina BUZ 2]
MAETEKSFGDKLLGFFIKDVPERGPAGAPASATPPASVPAGMQPGTNTLPPMPSPAAGSPTGAVDTKFVDHFAGVLSKANLQGPDYFEFREILRNLANLGLTEEKQFQAAWASFKAMAGTGDPGTLATAANQYLAALSTDREAFLKSVEAAVQERVGGLQTEQKKLQADNDAIAKQIAELQQRVNANNDRLGKIGGEIDEQSAKINQNRANFETTYASFTDQIKADISKITAYLK